MSIKARILFAVIVAASLFALYYAQPAVPAPPDTTRNINYSVTVSNQSNAAIPDLKVRVFHPRGKTSWQRVSEVDASTAFEPAPAENADYLEFSFLLPPYGTKVINLTSSIELWRVPLPSPPPTPSALTPLVNAKTNAEFSELAASLKRESPLATARELTNWLNQNLTASEYSAELVPLPVLLKERRGDCTDFANLFVALARANGIPARTAAGFVIERDRHLRASEYHNWAEFYADGSWKLADPIQGVFDSSYEKYVSFGYLDSSDSTPSQIINIERFSATSKEVSIKLN